MTSRADLNDKWAAYAGPGGWNGKIVLYFILIILSSLSCFSSAELNLDVNLKSVISFQ